jgi:hypothetical protein
MSKSIFSVITATSLQKISKAVVLLISEFVVTLLIYYLEPQQILNYFYKDLQILLTNHGWKYDYRGTFLS